MAPLPKIKASAVPAFDETAIRAHCEMLHHLAAGIDGVLVVSTYHANPTGDSDTPGIVTHHSIGDVDGMVDAVMAHASTPSVNVFSGLQVMRRGLQRGKRGTEADIVALLGLVVDLDADTGKAGGMPIDPNMVLETSPGNYQPFVLFDRALSPAEAKPLAAAMKRATESDHGTADVCHVWRVPGTLNWPNRKKLERGRSPDPVAVTVAERWDGTFTPVGELHTVLEPWASAPASERSVTLGELPSVDGITISPRAAEMLAANDVGDRSAHASRVVERLAFDGLTAEQACAVFLAATGDWLHKYPTEDRARTDFQRAWGKFGAHHAEERAAALAVGAGIVANFNAKRQPPSAANDNTPALSWPRIISSAELVRGFIPPDYFIDGVAQKGFIYSLTAATGTGKTAVLLLIAALAAEGGELSGREVSTGRVIYFAGENPDDVTMRWIGMAHETGFILDEIDVHFIKDRFSVPEAIASIRGQVEALGGADLIVIDTSAAYFHGTDENGNTELGKHARDLRMLTTLPGRPCVMVACHPTKNAGSDNLLPRGGGAFIAEVDGNLTLAKSDGIVRMHWQGKHRGPDFDPISIELKTITHQH